MRGEPEIDFIVTSGNDVAYGNAILEVAKKFYSGTVIRSRDHLRFVPHHGVLPPVRSLGICPAIGL
jgi:hypothetical protein